MILSFLMRVSLSWGYAASLGLVDLSFSQRNNPSDIILSEITTTARARHAERQECSTEAALTPAIATAAFRIPRVSAA
jgi:hypothetical protein